MPSRRNDDRGAGALAAAAVGALALRLWAKVVYRPVDSLAIFGAVAVTLVIIVNAVFLQSGVHPAPFFANPAAHPAPLSEARTKPVVAPQPAPQLVSQAGPQPAAIRRNDPIADLIGPSPRIQAVQRVLSEYGYGQIKPNGILDNATSAAIGKFEREHKLPVTGRVTDRLVNDLAAMTGHPVQ